MLLVYYKTLLAFSTVTFFEERSNILLREISKTYYFNWISGIFGRVYKGFKLKKEEVEPFFEHLSNEQANNNFQFWHLSLSLSRSYSKKERKKNLFLSIILCKTSQFVIKLFRSKSLYTPLLSCNLVCNSLE